MSREETGSGRPLELRCEAIAPWLWRVSWAAGGTVATDAEREQIAQVAASRASGALVVLAPVADPRNPMQTWFPGALQPVMGDVAGVNSGDAPLALGMSSDDPWLWFAPRGRGRVVMASTAPSEVASRQFVEHLTSKAATTALLAKIESWLVARTGRRFSPFPQVQSSVDDGELVPASPDSLRFDYSADGDGLFL